jgi:hypothetical protein
MSSISSAVQNDPSDRRERFRSAVGELEAGALKDVLTAIAYARDDAARVGAPAASRGRWMAVVAAAERATREITADAARPSVAA